MTDAELLHRLEQMQKEWDNAPKERKDYDDELEGIEDGEGYIGRVESFDGFAGRKDPTAFYLKTAISIQNHAEHGGRQLTRLDNIMDAEKIGYLKQFLYTLGVNVEALSMSELAPGSDTLNSLLDVTFTFDIYTNKKGYRNWAARARLDDSDLGNTQEQIAGFENNTTKPTNAQMAAAAERALQKASKPDNCTCPDPENGVFDDVNCPVPGHSIGF